MEPEELRQRAYRYRDLATRITDAQAIKALYDLADEYDAHADRVSDRAHSAGGKEQDC
jgi:hypothetical protein